MAGLLFVWFASRRVLASVDPATGAVEVGAMIDPANVTKGSAVILDGDAMRPASSRSVEVRKKIAGKMRARWAARRAAAAARMGWKPRKITAAQRAKMVAGIRRHWAAKRKGSKAGNAASGWTPARRKAQAARMRANRDKIMAARWGKRKAAKS